MDRKKFIWTIHGCLPPHFTKIPEGDQSNKNKKVGTCRTHGEKSLMFRNFMEELQEQRPPGRIILKRTLGKQDV
jgi:hypothetical protein